MISVFLVNLVKMAHSRRMLWPILVNMATMAPLDTLSLLVQNTRLGRPLLAVLANLVIFSLFLSDTGLRPSVTGSDPHLEP